MNLDKTIIELIKAPLVAYCEVVDPESSVQTDGATCVALLGKHSFIGIRHDDEGVEVCIWDDTSAKERPICLLNPEKVRESAWKVTQFMLAATGCYCLCDTLEEWEDLVLNLAHKIGTV